VVDDEPTKLPRVIPSTKAAAIAGVVVALVVLALGVPLLARGPEHNDSSEWILVGTLRSLAHPPGFPLWSALCDVVVHLAPANPYFALAVVTLILQSLAAAVVTYTACSLARDVVVGAALALSFALFAPSLAVSTYAEVFALHHALLALVFLLALRVAREPSTSNAAWLGLACGAAAAHHPASTLALPFVLGALLCSRKDAARRVAIWLASACVVGASYLSLTLRFANAPFFAVGHVDGVLDAIRHALRVDYGVLAMRVGDSSSSSSFTSAFVDELRSLCALPVALVSLVASPVVHYRARARNRSFDSPLGGAGASRRALVDADSTSTNVDAAVTGASAAPKGSALAMVVGSVASVAGFVWFATQLQTGEGGIAHGIVERFFPTLALPLVLVCADVLRFLPRNLARVASLAGLAPVLALLPSSLAAADARSDVYPSALVHQIESAPKDAVIATREDVVVFGLDADLARGVRPDLVHVPLGRIDAWWERDRLVARFPDLAALDANAPSWETPLLTFFVDHGRRVFVPPGEPTPAGIVAVPNGPLDEWVRAPVDSSRVDDGFLSRCRAIPDEIASVSTARAASFDLAHRYSLAGLDRRSHGDDATAARLRDALAHLGDGDLAGARDVCAAR
jgi:hypothetical protein